MKEKTAGRIIMTGCFCLPQAPKAPAGPFRYGEGEKDSGPAGGDWHMRPEAENVTA